MLNAHKSKLENEIQPNYETCQAKETPEHYTLHCSKYNKEREVLFKRNKIYKKRQYIATLTMEDVFGEPDITHNDHKSLREAFEKYINSTKKDF